jgi:hypothetical protein
MLRDAWSAEREKKLGRGQSSGAGETRSQKDRVKKMSGRKDRKIEDRKIKSEKWSQKNNSCSFF